jgi:DNA primase
MPKRTGLIPSEVIEDIRQRADIAQVIGENVTLKRVGSRLVGLCPFHQDTDPSFYVDPQRGAYKCFGCGEGGDVFRYVMQTQRLEFIESVRYLADRVGVDIPETSDGPRRPKGWRERLHAANETALSFYREMLIHPEIGRDARAYLRERGMTQPIVDAFELGYAPGDGEALVRHLQKKGVSLDDAQTVRVINKRDGRAGYYDFFRGRLMCPVRTVTGKAVAFSGRLLSGDGPKYINSSESDVFKKHNTFYAMNLANRNINQEKLAIVCEGNFDVMALHQHGLNVAVAGLGTAFTAGHADMLERYPGELVFLFDGDTAGKEATYKLVKIYAKREAQPRTVLLPDGMDPDDFLKVRGPEDLRVLLKNAPTLFEAAMDHVFSKHGNDAEGVARATSAFCEVAAQVSSPIRRGLLAKTLAARAGLTEDAVRRQIDQTRRGGRAPIMPRAEKRKRLLPEPEWTILATLLHYPTVRGKLDRDAVLMTLPHGPLVTLGERLWSPEITGGPVGAEDLLRHDDEDELVEAATTLLMAEAPCNDRTAKATIGEAVARRESEKLREEMDLVRKQRDQARQDGNTARADELEHRLHSLRKQLEMIRL